MWLQGHALLEEINDKQQFSILTLVCKKEHAHGQ